jgi:FkbM family methyltransferase
MSFYESIASALIGTPLQRPAEGLRWALGFRRRWKHPELREVFLEGERAKALMTRTITPGMNCIDVGCHLGSVLNEMVRLAPQGRHVAVEPLPYKAAWLRGKFPGVEVHQVALGEAESDVSFHYNPRHSGFSGLKAHGEGQTDTITVRCRRLDDLVAPGTPIGFVKVDVEGGEYGVFRGARRLLGEGQPVLLFECTRSGLSAFGVSASQVYSLLVDELGYRIFLLGDALSDGPPLDLPAFESSMVYPFRAFNYAAFPARDGR